MSGPVTSVARVEDVQIFLKDPVFTGVSKPQTDFLNLKLKGLRPFETSVNLLVDTA